MEKWYSLRGHIRENNEDPVPNALVVADVWKLTIVLPVISLKIDITIVGMELKIIPWGQRQHIYMYKGPKAKR